MRRMRRPCLAPHSYRSSLLRPCVSAHNLLGDTNQSNSTSIHEHTEEHGTPSELQHDQTDDGSLGTSSHPFSGTTPGLSDSLEARIASLTNADSNFTFGSLESSDADRTEGSKYARVLKAIREVISCCACFSSDVIMKECTNGHLICQNCFLTLRQDERPQCPTCRANLYSDSRRALIAQKVLSELPDTCPDCNTTMLHKSLSSHRLNTCPKRRVACGLAPLGCGWIGTAGEYEQHHRDCFTRKTFLEQPLGDNLESLLLRFRKREQSMRETFHCFSSVIRHLEAHEMQTITVTLSAVTFSPTNILYRSDHFHINQSRWTAEVMMTFPESESEQATADIPETQYPRPSEESDTAVETRSSIGAADATSGLPTNVPTELPEMESSVHDYLFQNPSRRRRWNHHVSLRHHPYHTPLRHTLSQRNPDVDTVCDGPHLQPQAPTTRVQEEHTRIGEISFRMLKENSPGIGRRAYAFILLHIEVPEAGIQIYARPQVHTHRFSARGDNTPTFNIHPIRWRYISCLNEMKHQRLIQAEFVVARRLMDDHIDT